MKLHRLAVTHFKGVAEREVTFPESGVIVLEGPNEVGKTSLIEALDLLLEEKDSSKKREVLAMQPVGLDVASAIEAEISTGPYRFSYRKQWFKQPSTVLKVTAPKIEQLTGLAAHERVTRMLRETTDLFLWKALRLVQATPLTQDDLSGSTALTAALDRAAGQNHDAGTEGDSLVQVVESVYATYFTARMGSPTGEYRAAADRLGDAHKASAAAEAALQDVEQDVDRHARVVDDLSTCESELEEARSEAQKLAEEWQQVASLVDETEKASKATLEVQREYARAVERRDERGRLVQEMADDEAAFEKQALTAQELTNDLAPLAEALATHLGDLETAQDQEVIARRAAEVAAGDLEHLRQVESLSALASRLKKIDEASQKRAEAHSSLSRLPVDASLLDEVEKAHNALELARVEQLAASAQLTVTGLADGQLLRIDGEQISLGTDETIRRSLSEPFDVVIPDSLRFALEPESGATARIAKVAVKQTALNEALSKAGAADLQRARDAYEQRRTAEDAKRRAEDKHIDLLDGESLEDLRDNLQTLQDSASAYAEGRNNDVPLPGGQSLAASAASRAQEAYESARTEVTRVTNHVEPARSEVDRLKLALAGTEAQRETTKLRLESDRDRLETQREIVTEEELEAKATKLQSDLGEREGVERDLATKLQDHDPESLKVRTDSADAALPTRERRRQELRDTRVGIEARLEQTGSQGRQELYDTAMTELEHTERAHAAIDRRAKAAQLLRATLQLHRAEAQRAYVEPFADAVTRLGRIVFGADFAVEVTETLSIDARVLGGRRIEFSALSSGAKEQMAVITRLACSTLIDGDHGVPVVIDDALGYSDPDKLKRICAAFSLLGHDSQVLLLTCTPGRYAAISTAEVIPL